MSPLILVVENNLAESELIQEVLPMAGITASFEAAVDGTEALARLRSDHARRPDLVLLDLNLWGLHGREVLATIKADAALCDIPIIILTTSAEDGMRAACLALGAAGFYIKPGSVRGYDDLSAGVRACLEAPRV